MIVMNVDLKEVYRLATEMTVERLNESPNYDLYIEINRQLGLMKDNILNQIEPTEEEKMNISIGLLAVRELEEVDTEYSDVLSKLSYLYKHPKVSSIES